MAYTIRFNNSVFAKGTEFAVGDYFLAINGESVEVDDVTADRYKRLEGKTLKEGLGKKFEVKYVKSEKFVPEEGSTDSFPEVVVETEPETLITEIPHTPEGGDK